MHSSHAVRISYSLIPYIQVVSNYDTIVCYSDYICAESLDKKKTNLDLTGWKNDSPKVTFSETFSSFKIIGSLKQCKLYEIENFV